jgi:hypothetical protein
MLRECQRLSLPTRRRQPWRRRAFALAHPGTARMDSPSLAVPPRLRAGPPRNASPGWPLAAPPLAGPRLTVLAPRCLSPRLRVWPLAWPGLALPLLPVRREVAKWG